MSRGNKEISAFCGENLSSLASLTNLTISDPNRLKIPFGGKGKFSGRQASWPVISDQESNNNSTVIQTPSVNLVNQDVVLEISKPNIPIHTKIRGFFIPIGYICFGICLAFCNLMAIQSCQLVCSLLCPFPMTCLMAHAISGCKFQHTLLIMACAFFVPLECALWNVNSTVPFILILAASVTWAAHKKGATIWILMVCVILSLCLVIPIPNLNLDPKWGITVSLFFLCILCAFTSLSSLKVTYTVECL